MDLVEFHTAELAVGGVVLLKLLPLPPPDAPTDQSRLRTPRLRPPGEIKEPVRDVIMAITMGNNLPNVDPEIETTFDKVSVTWTDDITLTIVFTQLDSGHRYDVEWCVHNVKRTLRDVISMTSGRWFGGAVVGEQRWPLELRRQPSTAYVTSDARDGRHGGVIERYWLSSRGVGLLVHADCPLHVGVNDKQGLLLESKWETPYNDVSKTGLSLKYSIFQSSNILTAHNMVTSHFPKPRDIPDVRTIRLPTWSTWAVCKRDVTQDHVIHLAKQIIEFRLPVCQVQIDEGWMKSPGDLAFNAKTFPDPHAMVETLGKLGVRVTVSLNAHCGAFSDVIKEKNVWLSGRALAGYTTWWAGFGKLLDITNIDAVRWFLKRLVNFRKQYKLLSFRFTGGETYWVPKWPRYREPPSDPCEYSRSYAALAAAADTKIRAQQVRVGNRTQHLPVFIRMPDKLSSWGYNHGIRSIIPTVLTHSILGYPFVMCDVIGSGDYFSDNGPSKELFVRWLQLAVFMPGLQLSHVPWNYDDETIMIARKMFQLREQYSDVIVKLARDSVQTGQPIIRPLWWLVPDDEVAQTIDSQFLVGDEILVAPILQEGGRMRDVYLPPGRWRDMLHDETLIGGRWRKGFPVKLDELPHFVKVKVKINLNVQENSI